MRTRTDTIEVESNGDKVWLSLNGKRQMELSIEDYDNLMDASERMNKKLAKFFDQ